MSGLLPDRSGGVLSTFSSYASQAATTASSSSPSSSAMEETAMQHYIIGDNLRNKAFYDDAILEFQRALQIQEPLFGLGVTVHQVAQTQYGLGLSFRGSSAAAVAVNTVGTTDNHNSNHHHHHKNTPSSVNPTAQIGALQQALHHLNVAAGLYEKELTKQKKDENKKKKKEETSNIDKDEAETKSNDNNADADDDADDKDKLATLLLDCKLNIARTHHSSGVIYQRQGEYLKSIQEHRKSLAIREHLLGQHHLETARSYYVLGCALSDQGGHFEEAIAELRRCLKVRLLIFGKDHQDTQEVLSNIGTVLTARGDLPEHVQEYVQQVIISLSLEMEGERYARLRNDYENALVCYRKAVSLEEQCLGELHPTTCDLYLKMADTFGELEDLESSLQQYQCAIMIYERTLGKYHVKVASIYSRLASILMEKGEYETALSFYCKAYGIYDSVLGNHDDTKHALMNVRLAAAKERSAKESMDLIKKAEQDFHAHQELKRQQEKEVLEKETEIMKMADALNPNNLSKTSLEDATAALALELKKEEEQQKTMETGDVI